MYSIRIPKNKELENIFEQLTKHTSAIISPKLATSLGRYKEMRFLREKNIVFIGMDRIKGKSIIALKYPYSMKKQNKHYFLKFLK